MDAYVILYWLSNGKPDNIILSAENKEDAIKKADKDPNIVYYCDTKENWDKFCEDRRGNYK
jgi:hypothetical protein